MDKTRKAALVTGAAQRIGKATAIYLHEQGYNVVIHYHTSHSEAENLAIMLNQKRPDSAAIFTLDLLQTEQLSKLIAFTEHTFGRLDLLVNNASSFFATEIEEITENAWHCLMDNNVKAPLFLAKAATSLLKKNKGSIIGLIDIHAERPLKSHIIYNISKSAHAQLIRTLALELAPDIRVNGIAPGCNIWPENNTFFTAEVKEKIENTIPLQRTGTPEDLAQAIFLLSQMPYVTGQILAVDGGRRLSL